MLEKRKEIFQLYRSTYYKHKNIEKMLLEKKKKEFFSKVINRSVTRSFRRKSHMREENLPTVASRTEECKEEERLLEKEVGILESDVTTPPKKGSNSCFLL